MCNFVGQLSCDHHVEELLSHALFHHTPVFQGLYVLIYGIIFSVFFVFTCLAVFISKSLALQISAFIILSGYFCSLRKRFNSGNRTSKLLCAETIRQIRLVKQITLRKHAYSNIENFTTKNFR